MLYLGAFAVFSFLWVVVWLLIKAKKRRGRNAGDAPKKRPYWIRDSSIPRGLRALALVQYLLAFFYALYGLGWLLSEAYHSHLADWFLHALPFCVLFVVLAIRSANGYIKGSASQGYRLAIALGWLCVIDAALYWLWGNRFDFDPISPVFGVALLVSLHWKYRSYFANDSCRQDSR